MTLNYLQFWLIFEESMEIYRFKGIFTYLRLVDLFGLFQVDDFGGLWGADWGHIDF